MTKLEDKINNILNHMPFIKKIVKRIYQFVLYMFSSKVKFQGDILQVTPDDQYEYFFGYYDKSPWDASERYMLCLRVKNTTISTAPHEPADIILIDTSNNNAYDIIATTRTWNIQQGCMLQWLGPDYTNEIIYNDFRDGRYCSVILNIKTKDEKIIDLPIYSVSNDGTIALTLDFSRLHRLRKGYGYYNLEDSTANDKLPDKTCIWSIDIQTNKITSVLKYSDLAKFEPRAEMNDAEHKVNHIMLNPSGDRFMVLHRWFKGKRKYTRLITANIDGSDMYNLCDDGMVSHCCWKSNTEILAFATKKHRGNGYFLLQDRTPNYTHICPEITSDGHPSFSPDGNIIVTDTYPDRKRMASILMISDEKVKFMVKVFAPFKYDNDFRCDLHPRWNRSGNEICFDSVFKGKRGLYIHKLDEY